MRSRRYAAIVTCAIAALALMIVSRYCGVKKQYMRSDGVQWTTDYHITYEASHPLNDSVQRVFSLVDSSASVFNPKSLVTALNQNKTNRVDSLIARMYNTALTVNKATRGAYDPTVMPLVNAWGFGFKSGRLPTQRDLDSLLAFVGLEKTRLHGLTLIKDNPNVQFDFSSIAKGLACDEIARMLERNGVVNYMVEIGGEIACRGVNAQGKPWHVSVDLPLDESTAASHKSALTVQLDKGGVATSGNYRKYKEVQGKRVSHIVNPKTGQSEESDLLSVTVVAPDCMSADAWATGCMVMGTERTKKLMEANSQLGVMTISADKEGNFVVWSNRRFAQLMPQP